MAGMEESGEPSPGVARDVFASSFFFFFLLFLVERPLRYERLVKDFFCRHI